MNDLQIMSLENTDITTWDFPSIKAELQRHLDDYTGIVYTDLSIKEAKSDRTTLNKLKKAIEDKRKDYKARCLAPYESMEPKIKELLELVEKPRSVIDETIKDYENRQKDAKQQMIKAYYDKKAERLGVYAESLYEKLLDKRWENASTPRTKYEEEVQTAINNAADDIDTIKSMDSPFVETLIKTYIETLSVDQVKSKQEELENAAKRANLIVEDTANGKSFVQPAAPAADQAAAVDTEGGVAVRIYASQYQMDQITDFMKALGIRYEFI